MYRRPPLVAIFPAGRDHIVTGVAARGGSRQQKLITHADLQLSAHSPVVNPHPPGEMKSGQAHCLDAGVEAFGAGVGDPLREVGQQAGLVSFEGLRGVDDRL
jgi:hypothetical protein